MPIPEQRDLEATRPVLAEWFARDLGVADVEIGPIEKPGLTGFSNETLLFDLSYTPKGRARRTEGLVVRTKPTGHTVFLESDFETQYRVLETLGVRTDVPVPVVRGFESDPSVLGSEFFVMERLDGCRVPGDAPPYTLEGWVTELSPEERTTMAHSGLDALVRIHSLDWHRLGLADLSKPQYGTLGFAQQLAYYEASFEWAAEGRPEEHPIVLAALEHCRANAPAMDPEITLCWGDARPANQMYGPDCTVQAVVDWEMVTLADPMMDLGWWLFLDRHSHEGFGATRLPGWPTREEMAEYYEQRSGRRVRDLEFYEIFAGLRFGVVMMRLATLLREFELLPAESDMAQNNTVTQNLAVLLDLPAPGPPVAF